MRHGAVDYFDSRGQPLRSTDVPLSELGRQQAECAGRALAGVQFDRVITSGLARTRQTAEIVLGGQPGAHRVPPLEPMEALNEIRRGALEDIPTGERRQTFTRVFGAKVAEDTRFLGGESFGELLDRVLPVFEGVLADSEWDTVLMVLHGGVNRALLSRILTGRRLFLGRFEQANACINIMDVGHTDIVRAVNINAADLVHAGTRNTTMEDLLRQYRAGLTQERS
jgi:probable phosphoglycerate mutase